MFTEVNGSDYLARQNAVHTLLRQKLGCTVTDLQLSLPDLGLSCEFYALHFFFTVGGHRGGAQCQSRDSTVK